MSEAIPFFQKNFQWEGLFHLLSHQLRMTGFSIQMESTPTITFSFNGHGWSTALLLGKHGPSEHLQLVDSIFQVTSADISRDYVHHLLTDGFHLRVFGVSCLLDLVCSFLGETDTEQPQEVTIGGFDINSRFNECLIVRRPTKPNLASLLLKGKVYWSKLNLLSPLSTCRLLARN